MRAFVDEHLADRRRQPLRILDLGSMNVNGSYRPLFDDPAWTYVGADVEPGDGVDVVLRTPYRWRGLDSNSFDVVISGQAFEHIEFPWVTILEVGRVLKVGGIGCLIAPAGGYEHRYPVDCWRYYRDGARALAHWADLDVLEATTNWAPHGFTDDSDQWMDTRVILTKRDRSLLGKAKLGAMSFVLRLQAGRRTVL